jgi:hypothetical protein
MRQHSPIIAEALTSFRVFILWVQNGVTLTVEQWITEIYQIIFFGKHQKCPSKTPNLSKFIWGSDSLVLFVQIFGTVPNSVILLLLPTIPKRPSRDLLE